MKMAWVISILFFALNANAMELFVLKKDTISPDSLKKNTEIFYDSLAVKANRHKVTKWLYDYMINTTNDSTNKGIVSYDYYNTYKNKTIGTITIKSLDIFGPDFDDTTKTTHLWIEKTANKLHTNSNLNVIRKNVWLKEGMSIDPNLLMDNERYLRSLPYIKDVRFVLQPRAGNKKIVDILILTKDVFSLGLTGSVSNIHNGQIGVFDKNVLGIGHEVGVTFFGHSVKKPNLGFEAFYSLNNVKGNFVDFSAGYANNFIRNEFFFSFERDFLRPQTVYAGGLTAIKSYRSNFLIYNPNVNTPNSLNYVLLDGWYGRRLNVAFNPNDSRFQFTVAGRVRYTSFKNRPAPDKENRQFFANSTLYLGSVSFSQRSYVRDYRIYSYGIVEDIPKGYLHEIVFGYDNNEFGDRGYAHIFLSSGNLFKYKPYYFYTALGLGSFFRTTGLEQGLCDVKINFISPLFKLWRVPTRQFIRLNYSVGIQRFEIEDLTLRNNIGIRGFGSRITTGKQRITLNVENVFFYKKAILNFQTALFYFLDAGIVGPANKSIFNEDYFAGVGVGLRIRNENLIFKTVQIRLSLYPNHPADVNAIGFILDEVPKSRFYSFQPRGPEPLKFE
ncbi:MAG TPA: hypothetical protein VK469_02685 [Candidatus Kapabacteria bacterium]|nr:hypothetical protein [Candidatus Kapabacteria bacterium]